MKIFISYAHVDEVQVRELVEILRDDANHDVWFDPRLVAGKAWEDQLLEAIQESDCFLYALTPESVASKWCQWEFAQAVHAKKPVVPIKMQANVTFGGVLDVLNRVQYVDFCQGATRRAAVKLVSSVAEAECISPESVPLFDAPHDQPEECHLPRIEDVLPSPFEWIDVPTGPVMLEDASADDGTQGGQYLVGAFAIAKYPITDAQYKVFVDDKDGFFNYQWWKYSNEAMQWRMHHGVIETASTGADLPHTHVSWYEAIAFCLWLSERTGQNILLPTEQQWQRAAQDDDGRIYPWGNKEPNDQLCNFDRIVGETTPVTQYPMGASPYGAMDMSGNVGEWCLTAWKTDSIALQENACRVVRGGSWRLDQYYMRAAFRSGVSPESRRSVIGFRIVHISHR